MGDPIQSFLADYEQSDLHIPEPRARCCCGNEACAFLKHNQNALDGLERHVSTAARLGKALLMRHETYIADSERERKSMMEQIETLETEKEVLEKKNAISIEENRALLDQLESLNGAVAESDAQILNLQATLQSAQQELQRLYGLSSRTEGLERQLAAFEIEQAAWNTSLEAKEQSEKSALRRCQKAERTVTDIQTQIERIESEANEERQRHVEIVERMERRHAVERELGSAAGRLKGAAALKTNTNDGNGTNVVSHFVKDILQDNANLQMGIVELRDMLNTSNEEVEKLRGQLSLHQPEEEPETATATAKAVVPREDLRAEMTRANSQELHVHHHYHAPPTAPKTLRRKKRVANVGHATPPSIPGTPRSSFSHVYPGPMTTILQQTSASVPQAIPERKRWSTQSNVTYTSLASSPQSLTNRSSSIFERVFSDAGMDSSRPSTPDTEDFDSPYFGPSHSRKTSASSFRSYGTALSQRRGLSPTRAGRPTLDSIQSMEELPKLDLHNGGQDTILEETEAEWENASSADPEYDADITSPESEQPTTITQDLTYQAHPPQLRRTTSHESVFSVAAMDIHTLKSRPSQLLAPYQGRGITSQAVISDTTAHAARPTPLSHKSADSRNLLSGITADPRQPTRPTLGRKVGGWVFGKWGGAAPTSTIITDTTTENNTKSTKPSSISSASIKSGDDGQMSASKARVRSPGVNQGGPILGFGPEVKIQHEPVLSTLDEEALRTALGTNY